MKQPSLGLYGAVLDVLSNADPWCHSSEAVMSRLVEHLTVDEAECLPHAIGGVLPLLRGDPDRLRLAVELAVRFDFFEIAGTVSTVAADTRDLQLLLNAADLAANTATDAPIRQRIMDVSLGELGQHRAIQIRMDQTSVPRTSDEERLYELSWPGSRAGQARFPLPPVVVIDAGFRADSALRLVVELARAGATVRRLDADSEVSLLVRFRNRAGVQGSDPPQGAWPLSTVSLKPRSSCPKATTCQRISGTERACSSDSGGTAGRVAHATVGWLAGPADASLGP